MAGAFTLLVSAEGIHEAEPQEVSVKRGAAVEGATRSWSARRTKPWLRSLRHTAVQGCDCDRRV
jgi:hypothetical protein